MRSSCGSSRTTPSRTSAYVDPMNVIPSGLQARRRFGLRRDEPVRGGRDPELPTAPGGRDRQVVQRRRASRVARDHERDRVDAAGLELGDEVLCDDDDERQHRAARMAFASGKPRGSPTGIGSVHDPRPPEPVRPAAVAAPPRRPPPAAERLGRGHGASRGRGRVPRGRDHQRRRGRRARLRGPRACAGRRDARRGRADRKGRRGARDGRRRGRIRDGAGRAGGCAAERRGRRLQPRGHRLRRRRPPRSRPARGVAQGGSPGRVGGRLRARDQRPDRRLPRSPTRRCGPRDPGGARSRGAAARECLRRGRRRLRVPDRPVGDGRRCAASCRRSAAR